ncbi:MAG TPA: hypothetical protein VF870_10015 [Ignavibacteriaceae bacterium]
MIEENEFTPSVSNEFIVNEPNEFYDDKKDFVTLEAWKKCREVKLFFYNEIIPLIPKEEKYNLGS